MQSRWDLDGDGTPDTGWLDTLQIEVWWEVAGQYAVTLEVRDPGGLVGSAAKPVAVGVGADRPPAARLTVRPDHIAEPGVATELTLDASASQDPEGEPLQVRWDLRGTGAWTAWAELAVDGVRTERYQEQQGFTVRVQVRDPGGQTAEAERRIRVGGLPELGDFREETIYFMMTTRFYDGDPSNNYYNRDRLELGDPHWRGDFKGLIEQLDYLHDDLGFTAIWITPIVTNRSGLDYHGYHGYDFTEVDPRLESADADLQALIDAMHARGMKLILDIVINHSSNYGLRGQVHNERAPIKYFREGGAFPSDDPSYPYQTNLGDYTSENPEDCDNPLAPDIFRTFDPEGDDPDARCPVCGQPFGIGHDANHFFNIDPQRLDATWYHQEGFIMGGDWENAHRLQQTHMAGDTIDLNTEGETVKRYVMDAYDRYLRMGVDALRIDTVKHVERDNLLEYVDHFKQTRPGLFVFGENLVKGTGWGDLFGDDNGPSEIRPWWYTRRGHDPRDPNSGPDSGFSVLDFSLFSTFRDNLSRGTFSGISGIFDRDWVWGDATSLVTFIDNHDVGPQNDWNRRFAGEDHWLASGLNLLFTARGIPCVYYGTEIRFKAGTFIDPAEGGPAMRLSESGRAYLGDHLTPERIQETRSHPMARHIKRLNQIRRAVPALQKGWQSHNGENGNSLWYVRDHNDGESYAVVGLSMGGGDIHVGGVRNGTYRDCVTGREVHVGDGNINFHVNGGSAGIYVLDGPGRIGEDGNWLR